MSTMLFYIKDLKQLQKAHTKQNQVVLIMVYGFLWINFIVSVVCVFQGHKNWIQNACREMCTLPKNRIPENISEEAFFTQNIVRKE